LVFILPTAGVKCKFYVTESPVLSFWCFLGRLCATGSWFWCSGWPRRQCRAC